MTNIRILVVDDNAGWRTFIRSIVGPLGWSVVGEASDGLEALQKAKDFNPDVILLDIGLPNLNGLDAARQIREDAPDARILFLSMFDSADMIKAALDTGASGYVLKVDAGSELVAALKAVAEGKRFVSSSLKGFASDAGHEESRERTESLPSGSHELRFYSNDGVFQQSVSECIGSSLRAGGVAILLATKIHRDAVSQALQSQGLDVAAAVQRGTYVLMDAAETLSTIMVNDWPDADRFVEAFKDIIESVSKAAKVAHPRVVLCGETAALLWAEGKTDAAIHFERLGDELAKRFGVDILCAYPFDLNIQEDENAISAICAEHSVVYTR